MLKQATMESQEFSFSCSLNINIRYFYEINAI